MTDLLNAAAKTNISFDLLRQQADELGFDEVVLILSSSKKTGPTLVRVQADKGPERVMEILDDVSNTFLENTPAIKEKVSAFLARSAKRHISP